MNDHDATRALQALAHGHRLAIFRLLVRCGTNGLPAGEIGRVIGMSPTATSFHLKELDHAGLVFAVREGRYIRYAIHVERMRALISFLTEDCCDGRPELCGGDIAKAPVVCTPPKAGAIRASRRPGRKKTTHER